MNAVPKTALIPRFQLGYQAFRDLYRSVGVNSFPAAGHSRFASHLALYFPDAAARIDEEDFGILHLEVGALKQETHGAIAKREWDVVQSHFAFVSEMLAEAGNELRDALEISYLGSLFYGEMSLNFARARTLLPKSLLASLEKIEDHYDNLVP
jgi:hypothetical protein